MRTYRLFCQLLGVLGLRSFDPEPTLEGGTRSVRSIYSSDDLHFTNWDLLKGRSVEGEGDRSAPATTAQRVVSWIYTGMVAGLLLVRPVWFAAVRSRWTDLDWATLLYLGLLPVQYLQALRYLATDHIEPHLVYGIFEADPEKVPFSSSASSASQETLGSLVPSPLPSPSSHAAASSPPVTEPSVELAEPKACSHRPSAAASSWQRRAGVGAVGLLLLAALGGGLALGLLPSEALEASFIPLAGSRGEWLGRLLAVVDTLFGRLTQLLNLGFFVLVFLHHIQDLRHIEECIQEHIFRSIGTSLMIHHIILVRHSIDVSVRQMHGIFSTCTLCGALSLGCLAHHITEHPVSDLPVYLVLCTVTYLLVQVVYVLLIYQLSEQRQRLLRLLHLPRITACCLNRMEGLSMRCSADRNIYYPVGRTSDETLKNVLVITAESASTLDWNLLQCVLERQWEEFHILGIRVNDGSLFLRCTALVGVLLSGKYLL